ncbi:LOW QUALITY PROTEIN: hypothetical protein HID58_011466 [Brassica napus]|uniref:Uncharacterized protein n=1 Tax=Brassica napus TaxID=3708 RepID=A0ABQ8DYF0_BRANA|nr:LOW QUALITY PROTEIN: hypothetical protein HID58_011466 [Brassica napus]
MKIIFWAIDANAAFRRDAVPASSIKRTRILHLNPPNLGLTLYGVREEGGKRVCGDLQVGDGEGESGERVRGFGRRRRRRGKEQELVDEGAQVLADAKRIPAMPRPRSTHRFEATWTDDGSYHRPPLHIPVKETGNLQSAVATGVLSPKPEEVPSHRRTTPVPPPPAAVPGNAPPHPLAPPLRSRRRLHLQTSVQPPDTPRETNVYYSLRLHVATRFRGHRRRLGKNATTCGVDVSQPRGRFLWLGLVASEAVREGDTWRWEEALKGIMGMVAAVKLSPIRVPSVMLLSWKKDPVDYNISSNHQ